MLPSITSAALPLVSVRYPTRRISPDRAGLGKRNVDLPHSRAWALFAPRRSRDCAIRLCRDREAERGDGVKTGREKAEEKRAEKLEMVREQVRSGSLVIRQMTDEERRRYPPRPVDPKRIGQRR